MVRRLANSRSAAKSDSTSISIPGPSSAVDNALLPFSVPESQGLRALFAGFIDLYCESIPELRRAHLKNELRALVVRLGVVPELFFSDALSPVRLVCSQLIADLVRSVLVRTEPPDNRSLPFLGRPQDVFNQSRFRTEFEEIETIGRGGFGHVYRVRSLLDKHEYAIKRIVARDVAEQLSQRILHEVQILANLQHANIVRYHCGWIEVERTASPTTSQSSSFPRPRRARKDSPRIAIQEIFDSDEDVRKQADQTVEELENGEEEEGGEESISSSVGLGALAAQASPVGGRFWGGAETSSESIDTESTTSHSCAASAPVDRRRNGEISSHTSSSSLGSAVVRESPIGGRFWGGAETSSDSIEEEESTEEAVPLPTTTIGAKKKERKEGGGGDGEWSEEVEKEEGDGRGQEVAVVMRVRMVIYIQMELCTSTLEKYMFKRNDVLTRKSSPVDGRECLSLFRQLISAVEYIHEKGLIHRDIKPGNLFLKMARKSSIQLLLGDFGLSCLDGDVQVEGDGDGMIVPSGAPHSIGVGTATYAAPEQMAVARYGREVDLYSSGIVLLELFTVVGTGSERLAVIEGLRERREVPEQVALKWPTVASLALRLTSPAAEERPSAAAVLNEINEEANEIRCLREELGKQKEEIAALREEVKRLRKALRKRGRTEDGERE